MNQRLNNIFLNMIDYPFNVTLYGESILEKFVSVKALFSIMVKGFDYEASNYSKSKWRMYQII